VRLFVRAGRSSVATRTSPATACRQLQQQQQRQQQQNQDEIFRTSKLAVSNISRRRRIGDFIETLAGLL
jgi:hypothetical protein